MPDPTPTPTPTPQKTAGHHGPISQSLIEDLSADREIIDAALDALNADPALATALGTHFLDAEGTIAINPTSLHALSAQAAAAAQAGADAVDKSSDLDTATEQESDAADRATAAIRRIQSGAKEKYEEKNRPRLKAFYVGQPLKSRIQIEQAATACWGQIGDTDEHGATITPKDTVPGIPAAQLPAIRTDLGDYVTAQVTQSGAQQGATDARAVFKNQCQQISRRRRRLQRAFDSERPFGEANTALRRRLQLPVDRGMS